MRGAVVITGAGGALAAALVSHLVQNGVPVVGIGRTARTLPGEARFHTADLSSFEQAKEAFDAIAETQPLAGLVNAAGGFAFETIAGGQQSTWEHMNRINLATAVNACQAALPHLMHGAAIVNIGSMSGLHGGLGTAAYAASKAGVLRLTESLAAELKPKGIRVNAVLPSIIDTEQNRRSMPAADRNEWVTPEALAKVIAFFLSADSAPITGALLPVTGMPRD